MIIDTPAAIESAVPPRRRWFSYSLRMLLAVITALCIWLAWQVKFVRDRKAMLESIAASGGSFGNVDPSDPFVDLFPSPPFEQSPHSPPISWLRQQLGDVGVGVIELPPASA